MMKRLAARLMLVAFLLISVPVITSTFNAQAGHSTMGGHVGEWCQCGCADCACDPGETPEMCINSAAPSGDRKPAKGGVDLGSLGLIGLAAFIAMLRRFGV